MNKSIQKVNILNGNHKTCAPITSNGNQNKSTYITVKQPNHGAASSGVQWTVKSLMDPNNSRGFSNINAWLSPKKLVDGKSTQSSSLSNGVTQTHTSGFDMTKLYPELSSKLGLTKSHAESLSQTNCSKSKGQLSSPVQLSFVSTNDPPMKVCMKKSIKTAPSTAKPINRNSSPILHDASIKPVQNARNKINGVRASHVKKSDKDASGYPSANSVREELPKNELLHNVLNSSPEKTPPSDVQQTSVVHIYPKKLLSFPKDDTTSACQIRVQTMYGKQYAYFSDLFPLGFNSNDEELLESASSNLSLPCQRFSDKKDCIFDPSNCPSLDEALGDIKQKVSSARERLKYTKSDSQKQSSVTKALIDAARENPSMAASAVSYFTKKSPHLKSKKRKSSFQTTLLEYRTCAYELDGIVCGLDALPGTRHCLKHITYNVDQQLFSQCSAKLEDNSFCRVPTFDVHHEPPLCNRHTDYVHPVIQPTLNHEPKKARKKNKMPIVSRYGKRNKKRRRSSVGSSTIIPSTCVRPSINTPGVCLGSPQASPLTPRTSPTYPTDKTEDSESDQELQVMDSSLSLDDTRLLDRDLQEVFNKFPASEFSNIFSAPETKATNSDEEFDESKMSSSRPVPDKDFSSSDSGIGTSDPSLETQNSANLPLSLDSNVLGELTTNGSIDSIISSSFNQQELNTISQVLSNIVHEDGLNLASFPLGSQNYDSELLKSDMTSLDSQHSDICFPPESQNGLVEGLKNQNDPMVEPLNSVDCKISLVRQANKLQIDAPTLPPLQ